MVRAFSLAFALLAAMLAPAVAGQPAGTAAWTNSVATVYGGPGTTYDELGEISADSAIRVDRCTGFWCQVRAGEANGWIRLAEVSFGIAPSTLVSGPRLDYPPGGAGVCFYTGANFTGSSFCLPAGAVTRDAALNGHDNSISSIQLEPGAKLRVCRDRNFRSWCELITQSEEHLSGLLDNAVSSWQVY